MNASQNLNLRYNLQYNILLRCEILLKHLISKISKLFRVTLSQAPEISNSYSCLWKPILGLAAFRALLMAWKASWWFMLVTDMI